MQTPQVLQFVVPDGIAPGTRLDAWLASASGMSRERIKKMLSGGNVCGVSGTAGSGDGKKSVTPGQCWTIEIPPPAPTALVAQDIPLSIVYEDDAVIVIDKPAGLVVHPANGHPDGTLVNAVLHHFPGVFGVGGEERPGIVHRLDRDTSGLMVVAKTDEALEALSSAFRSGAVHKTYLAITCGVPDAPSGHVENYIGRSPRDRKKMAVVESGGKFASTDWTVVEDFGEVALVRLRIHTGRTHQIRVHLSSFGCPVAGDRDYGSAAADGVLPFRPPRQMLHAWKLVFPHPDGGRQVQFESSLPSDFKELLDALRTEAHR